MNESENSSSTTEIKRRRRRRQAPVEEVGETSAALTAAADTPHQRDRRGWLRWNLENLFSVGAIQKFRAYIFVGSIVAILAFLFYNESIIREFRDGERGRVKLYADLYAFAASPLATGEQTELIFREVLTNPRGDFPIIFTDYKGDILNWKGEGLPDPNDRSPAAQDQLHAAINKMDAQNVPIPFEISSNSFGSLFYDTRNLIVLDNDKQVVAWRGADLPAEGDSSLAALNAIQRVKLKLATEGRPLDFEITSNSRSYVHFDGIDLIVTNSLNELVVWRGENLPPTADSTTAALKQVADVVRRIAAESSPLAFEITPTYRNLIHYGDSHLLSRLTLAPFIQIGVLLLFVLIGYVGFRNIRRSEQRIIWVGMAKETAHQLGTPLSSLSGWLELIQSEIDQNQNSPERLDQIQRMIGEMQKDMGRLSQIASRFSQIGSVPELKLGNVGTVLEETITYFRDRGPQFGRHQIRIHCQEEVPPVPVNSELMSWVFENLFKNSMDAIGRKSGEIEVCLHCADDNNGVRITFRDNGCGITTENVGRVFEPGFSTKKRGWGLGLAFVKRIVEEYHKGKIAIARSTPDEGTMIVINLPLG